MLKDRFGTEVTVGCVIAYSGRQSSNCWITTGEVIKIDDKSDLSKPWQNPGRICVIGGHQGRRIDPNKELGKRWVEFNIATVIVVRSASSIYD